MKKLLFVLLGCCLSTLALAQNITVKGTVIDSVTNAPVSYLTAALQDAKTQAPVKAALTKDDGSFELTAPSGKAYQLILTFVGYKTKIIAVAGTADVNVGKQLLLPTSKELAAVSIVGVKPLMKQEVDRISYDVQADPESKTITALDMMRKVPLLSVDATDNIKLRGTGNYKILINGKESALMAKSPSDILKAMPATNVLKIEVITTPPAKYDAEGLAGIINIITVKNADQGYNGSINTSYNNVWGYRANLNLTIKQGKIGYSGYLGHGERKSMGSDFENGSTFYQPNTTITTSTLLQKGRRFNGNNNTYTGNELSYEIDSLNLLTGTFNLYTGNGTQGNNQFTVARDANQAVTRSYNLFSNGTGDYRGSDLGLNYQLGFKHNKDQLLTVSYKYSNSDNKQFNSITSDHGLGYSAADYRQYNNSGSKEYTTQIDYIHPLKTITIEAGGKMILRNNFSNFSNDTLNTSGQYVTDPKQTNNFTYHQNVYSLYNSYQLKFTKYTFKGGLRFERTNIDADFTAITGGVLDRNYNNLVPSFSAQRSLNATSNLTFGFTQRIQRPGIWQLNPFTDRTNQQYINMGNPDLKPAVNNNFELSYGNFAKGSINISTSYSFANNTIQNVQTVNGTVTTTTYANIGKNKNLGLDVNINYPITTKLNVNINAEIMQVWLEGFYSGDLYTNSGQQGHIFTYTSYKFDNGLRMGVNIGFDSRYVMLQGRDNYYFFSSYSVSKEFKKKLNVNLSINNPFSEFNKLDFFTKTPNVRTYNTNMNFYRTVNIGVNYKFGKLNSAIKKNQRGINNDDTKNDSKN
jgi:outer membrane receptor protein involved in Fe transport